jgi:restriction system protein
MARRKDSVLDGLLDIAKMLPWWVDIAIAMSAYFWLHSIAASKVVMVVQPGKMGELISGPLFKALATGGQYLLPLIFLLGAGISFLGRKKREHLLSETKKRGKQNALLDIQWLIWVEMARMAVWIWC